MMVTDEEVLTESNSYYYYKNKDEVDYLLNLLPEGQRDKLYLRLVFGYSHKEIAEQLNITEGSSRVACKTATDNLKKLCNSEHPEDVTLREYNILKPYGNKPYAGDWAYRIGETEDRCHGKVKFYTEEEIQEYVDNKAM